MVEQNQQKGNNPNQSQSMNQNRDQGTGQGHGIAPAMEQPHIEPNTQGIQGIGGETQEQPHIEPNSQGIQGIEGARESDEGDSSWRGNNEPSASSKQPTFTGGESDLEDAGAGGI